MDVMIPPDMVNHVDSDDDDDAAVVEKGSGSIAEAGSLTQDEDDDGNGENNPMEAPGAKSVDPVPIEDFMKPLARTFSIDPPEYREGVGPQIVREDGLDFDLSQPWQRSLLRELRQLDAGPQAYRQAELLLLGHTDSRDYAVELGHGDDLTLTTDSSSTLPHRPQVIHRAWPYYAYQQMQQGGPMPTAPQMPPTHYSSAQPDQYPKHQYRDNMQQNKNSQMTGQLNTQSPRTLREERDISAAAAAAATAVKPEHGKAYDTHGLWLEMEPSGDFDDNATTAIQSDPGAACHCFGYNVLDLWMPAPRRVYRPRGPRRPIHPAYLGKLAEGSHEDDVYEERSHGVARESRYSDRVVDTVVREHDNRIAVRADPDGAYSAHHYYP